MSEIVTIPVEDYPKVVEVWEASVRATHHFLKEEDIQIFKPLILDEYLYAVELVGIYDEGGNILGFLGVAILRIEMLFVHPDAIGKGIGKKLLRYALDVLKATEVDVNEQNEKAKEFYESMGFEVLARSSRDGMGKPYPLLHMRLLGELF